MSLGFGSVLAGGRLSRDGTRGSEKSKTMVPSRWELHGQPGSTQCRGDISPNIPVASTGGRSNLGPFNIASATFTILRVPVLPEGNAMSREGVKFVHFH